MNQNELNEIYQGYSHFFPEGSSPSNDHFSRWRTRSEFIEEIKGYTKIDISSGSLKLIKDSQQILEGLVTTSEKAESERPDLEKLKTFEAEAEKREADIKKAVENAKRNVQVGIKRQEELAEKVRQKQAYIKSKIPNPQELSFKEKQALEELKKVNPRDLAKPLAQEIKTRISKNLPEGVSEQEVEILSKRAAYAISKSLSGQSLAEEALILNKIAVDKNTVHDFDPETAASLQYAAGRVANPKILEYLDNRRTVSSAFGEAFADNVIGPANLDSVNIEYSSVPHEGYEPYSFSNVPSHFSDFLGQENLLLNGLKDFSSSEIKSYTLSQLGGWIDGQVAKLPVDHWAAQAYRSEAVQGFFGAFLPGEPIAWEGTSFFGRIAIETGYGPTFGWLGQLTGIDFGVAQATTTIATEIGSTAIGTAAITGEGVAIAGAAATGIETAVVAGTGIAATEATIGATSIAAAPLTGGLSVIIGGLITLATAMFGPKVINWLKDNAKNIGKFAVIGAGVLFGAILGGFGGGLLGGIIGAGLSAGLTGGTAGLLAGASSFAAGATAVLGAIWATFMAGVATPILIILLVFPVVIALILFIINSGAYMVPPGASLLNSTNPYISVEKKADPSGQLASPQTITYTITITAKKDTLTEISFDFGCKAIQKSGTTIDCKSLEQIPAPPTSITPGSPFTFSFTSNYDAKYKDSLVSDTITVSAKSGEGGNVTATGSASICFGDCPLDCFDFSDPAWSQMPNLQSLLTDAAGTLVGSYPNFAAKVCAGGPVKICYSTNNPAAGTGIFARDVETSSCTINFNKDVEPYGPEGVLFLLTHEVTHHIQQISSGYFTEYMDKVNPPLSEDYICTRGDDSPDESMAEGDALFVADPIIDRDRACLTKSFQSQYPLHYDFAKNVMFAP